MKRPFIYEFFKVRLDISNQFLFLMYPEWNLKWRICFGAFLDSSVSFLFDATEYISVQ